MKKKRAPQDPLPRGKPLLEGVDHGAPIRVDAQNIGVAPGERWVEPFLEANRASLRRLELSAQIHVHGGVGVSLTPGSRIGAIPLVSPSTRRVAAGLLIKPRFQWAALGAVMEDIGFSREPSLGGGLMVPGSAREVPPWMLAGPVVRRLERLLRHRKRGFTLRTEDRASPRGRVDWTRWASTYVPSGRWTQMPCQFSEPDDDPELMAAIRWTLTRVDDELVRFSHTGPARSLRARISDLLGLVGPGPLQRPTTTEISGPGWVQDGLQAMGWVAEERGMGGAQSLDGLSWDLVIDEVWESWVDAFVVALAPRCGMISLQQGSNRRPLNWQVGARSMSSLIPDSGLRGPDRMVWVDAKYKAHLQQLRSKGWAGLSETMRDAHRADLHQALAYASLEDAAHVDSFLVYPELSGEPRPPSIATVAAGKRRVRLLLVGLPFGFRSAVQRERVLSEWRELLAS